GNVDLLERLCRHRAGLVVTRDAGSQHDTGELAVAEIYRRGRRRYRAAAGADQPDGQTRVLFQVRDEPAEVFQVRPADAKRVVHVFLVGRFAHNRDVESVGGEEVATAHEKVVRPRYAVLHLDAAGAAGKQHDGGRGSRPLHVPERHRYARTRVDLDQPVFGKSAGAEREENHSAE